MADTCVRQADYRGFPITSQNDCSAYAIRTYAGEGITNSTVSCVFDSDDNCASANLCNGNACYKTTLSCETDSDCDQYKYAASDNSGGSDSAPLAMCKNNLCYLDPVSYQRYQNNPGFTSIQQDFQIKKPFFEITIPGLSFSNFQSNVDAEGYLHVPYIAEFLVVIYKLAMVTGSAVAVVMIIIQGYTIMVSGDGGGRSEAYGRVLSIVVGVVILWGSYIIAFTVNPDLVQFKVLKVKFIEPIPIIDVIQEPVAPVPLTFSQVSASSAPGSVGKIPNYKQFAAPWGSLRYGDDSICTTIQASGCAPTTLAEVLASYGADVTPDKTAAWMGHAGNGRLCNRGTSMNQALQTERFATSPWGNAFAGKSISQDQAINYLKLGKPIIFLCKSCSGTGKSGPKGYGGHYMVLTGIDANGNILVNDPGANEQKAILVMTPDQLKQNGGFWYVAPKGQ